MNIRKTFHELSLEARKSPSYYLERLDIWCGEILVELKDKSKKTAYWNDAKRRHICAQVKMARQFQKKIMEEDKEWGLAANK